MADTIRSISALQTLFADNTSGDISAQDLRDFLVSAANLMAANTFTAGPQTIVVADPTDDGLVIKGVDDGVFIRAKSASDITYYSLFKTSGAGSPLGYTLTNGSYSFTTTVYSSTAQTFITTNTPDGITFGITAASGALRLITNNTDRLTIEDTGTLTLQGPAASNPALVSTGGNARGYRSIDFQFNRSSSSQVSSGTMSCILNGQDNTASGSTSLVSGSGSTASGSLSFARGTSCTASGSGSTAFGSSCIASGPQSFAVGSSCTAAGDQSAAIGSSLTVTGHYSTAIGRLSSVIGHDSFAFGQGCVINGDNSIASGNGNYIEATAAAVFGNVNDANTSASYSLVSGTYGLAYTSMQRVIGIDDGVNQIQGGMQYTETPFTVDTPDGVSGVDVNFALRSQVSYGCTLDMMGFQPSIPNWARFRRRFNIVWDNGSGDHTVENIVTLESDTSTDVNWFIGSINSEALNLIVTITNLSETVVRFVGVLTAIEIKHFAE